MDLSADAATAAAPTKRSFFIEEGVAEVTPAIVAFSRHMPKRPINWIVKTPLSAFRSWKWP